MQRTITTGAELELGIFSLTDAVPGDTGSQGVHDIVDVGAFADQAGLDAFGVGEHHTPRFAVSSPAVVLAAAVAARGSSAVSRARAFWRPWRSSRPTSHPPYGAIPAEPSAQPPPCRGV
ncbi:LLM class flavin-dependent oxidoreductase [Streptomyces sp. NPDC087428]|uniref:LLM class flavin-dependent oxidoreductase n=1 Tax=Streptomyces sp. NPDC087428 TaxID=3365788 RepID=UPI0037F61E4C